MGAPAGPKPAPNLPAAAWPYESSQAPQGPLNFLPPGNAKRDRSQPAGGDSSRRGARPAYPVPDTTRLRVQAAARMPEMETQSPVGVLEDTPSTRECRIEAGARSILEGAGSGEDRRGFPEFREVQPARSGRRVARPPTPARKVNGPSSGREDSSCHLAGSWRAGRGARTNPEGTRCEAS